MYSFVDRACVTDLLAIISSVATGSATGDQPDTTSAPICIIFRILERDLKVILSRGEPSKDDSKRI